MDYKEILDQWWQQLGQLSLESDDSEFNLMTDYLSEDCVLYFGGMNAPASTGKQEVKDDLRKTLSYWKIIERQVTSFAVEGNIVFCAMKNKLEILGTPLDSFYETEVVYFDEKGKIKRYELYCDPNPIQKIFSDMKN